MKKLAFCLGCIVLLALSASALAWEARVVAVSDGDTITIEPPQGGDSSKVRLYGIDCPETNQPYGQTAKAFVSKAVLFKTVNVQPAPQGKDRYGRIVAVIEIPGVGVLQELLLETGLAWVYPQYCKNCEAWEAMEAEARSQRKGLWTDKNPVEPWEWRKRRYTNGNPN